jgi:hypothetical protein
MRTSLLLAVFFLSFCPLWAGPEPIPTDNLNSKLQMELDWLNVEAIRLAFDDMKKIKGFDAAKYQPALDELEQLIKQGLKGKEDKVARAVALKRLILLANPLLDIDKIVATRFNLGENARKVMSPSLGTQSNNWSNQQSARRKRNTKRVKAGPYV